MKAPPTAGMVLSREQKQSEQEQYDETGWIEVIIMSTAIQRPSVMTDAPLVTIRLLQKQSNRYTAQTYFPSECV